MSARVGRVAAIHPEDNSVDLVMIDNGARMPGVQVLSAMASTNTGLSDLAPPSKPASGDEWSMSERTDRDLLAVCIEVGGVLVVAGFLFPQVCQMLFKELGRRVDRHSSDFYSTIDAQGNAEWCHPSGAFVRIATSPGHEDLTGKDADGKWKIAKNTDKQVHIHIEQAGGKAVVNIAPSGAISVSSKSTLQVDIDGAVVVNAPAGTAWKGDINVDGNINTTGDVKAGAISLKTHRTSGVTPGDGISKVPVV